MRVLRITLLVLGVVLLAVLVRENDPASILAWVRRLSWRLAIVVVFPAVVVTLFDTLGWRFAFTRDRVPFRTLLAARVAGEAFNLTTPTASVGGEAVKAFLLRAHVPLEESLPSVIVAKTTITIGQALLLLVGLVVAWVILPPESALLHSMPWFLGVEVAVLTLFVVAQLYGTMGPAARVLGMLGVRSVRNASGVMVSVDDALASFYRRQPARLVLSIAFHFFAWLLGAVEVSLTLAFLGIHVSWATALVIEAFGTAVKVATFVIPGSLGVLEGGFAAAFAAFGLGAPVGISFSLVRRVRELVWAGIGMMLFAAMRPAGARRG